MRHASHILIKQTDRQINCSNPNTTKFSIEWVLGFSVSRCPLTIEHHHRPIYTELQCFPTAKYYSFTFSNMNARVTFVVVSAFALILCANALPQTRQSVVERSDDLFPVNIIHINDFHARYLWLLYLYGFYYCARRYRGV